MSRFFIVDVFGTKPLTGNQLAVFTEGAGLSPATMQALAAEMHFSESTFICGGDAERGFDVRIFTPGAELPFAGHPALGTSFVLHRLLGLAGERVTLNLQGGPVQVSYSAGTPERYVLEHARPHFGPELPVIEVAAALGTAPASVGPGAPQVVSTGLPFALVPIRSLAVLSKLRPPGVDRFCAGRGLSGLLLFCTGTIEPANDLHARMFAGEIGLYEDPATGSAAGCLAAYLLRRGTLGEGPLRARLEQGYELGRPSLLWLEAEGDPAAPSIRVAGQVHAVAEGRLLAPASQPAGA